MIIQESALDYRLDPQLQMHCSEEVGEAALQLHIQDETPFMSHDFPSQSVLTTVREILLAFFPSGLVKLNWNTTRFEL